MTDNVLGNLFIYMLLYWSNVHLTANALHLMVIQTGNVTKVFNMTVLVDEITSSLNSNNNIYCKYYSILPVIILNDFRFKHKQTNKVSVKYHSRDMSKHKTRVG